MQSLSLTFIKVLNHKPDTITVTFKIKDKYEKQIVYIRYGWNASN